jgi:hypothetical protein
MNSARLVFFLPISSHIILFILPAEHYSFYQPNTPVVVGSSVIRDWIKKESSIYSYVVWVFSKKIAKKKSKNYSYYEA